MSSKNNGRSNLWKMKPYTFLKEVEMHVEAIQRLVKGQEKDLQELREQVSDGNKNDECGISSSISTISRHIDFIHQLINKEKPNFQPSLLSSDRKNMVNLAKKVLVVDTSSVEKALKNSVVLRTIMQHLDTKNLLNVRLVAKKWEEEATIQLLSTSQSHQVSFGWYWRKQKFENDVGTLEQFTKSCYGNPLRKFPCSNFKFEADTSEWDKNEAPVDISKFFSNQGHHIKILRLDSPLKSTSPLRIIRKIVFEWTPNLKSLTLNRKYPYFDNNDKDEPPTPEIENTSKPSAADDLKCSKLSLEHLVIYYDSVNDMTNKSSKHWSLLMTDILSSAPNLKTILDNDLRFTKEIVSAGKIGTVHRWSWKAHDAYMLARGIEFSQTRPQLTNLEVELVCPENVTTRRDIPSELLPSLQLILQSSQKTLKTLKFIGRLKLVTGASRMNIPVMENLQEFCVKWWNSAEGGQGRLLPVGYSFQKLFPRLKTLAIEDVRDKTTNQSDNPFGQLCNSSTTIEELTISTSFAKEHPFHPVWLRQARELYPNVRVLQLEFNKECREIPGICRIIWRSWNSLEELSIKLPGSGSVDSAEIMDQALTGFNRETCRILRKQRCCQHGPEAERFERGPSIVDLTKLKSFQLTTSAYKIKPKFPLLSRASVIHALAPMGRSQHLAVTINGVGLTEMVRNVSCLDFSVRDCEIIMVE